ncbi:MAG: STAS domain-containing protein [Planctomycetota bacterium]|jgi:anti-sigma B factor antagonist|nr:STAS domain-containing protein [Planctomycetota bacterium]
MQEIDNLDRDIFDKVLTVGANLTATEAPELRSAFQASLNNITGSVLLDMTGTEMIDSVGVSLVVGVFQECRKQGAQLQVAVSHPFVVKVFTVMHLHQHLDLIKVG